MKESNTIFLIQSQPQNRPCPMCLYFKKDSQCSDGLSVHAKLNLKQSIKLIRRNKKDLTFFPSVITSIAANRIIGIMNVGVPMAFLSAFTSVVWE